MMIELIPGQVYRVKIDDLPFDDCYRDGRLYPKPSLKTIHFLSSSDNDHVLYIKKTKYGRHLFLFQNHYIGLSSNIPDKFFDVYLEQVS